MTPETQLAFKNQPRDITGTAEVNNFELQPYQCDAIAATIKGFIEFPRELIVCPTGGGKIPLFAKIVEHYQSGRTLILAHREELLVQARDRILRATCIVAEIEAAECTARLDAPVVVGPRAQRNKPTYAGASRRSRHLPPRSDPKSVRRSGARSHHVQAPANPGSPFQPQSEDEPKISP